MSAPSPSIAGIAELLRGNVMHAVAGCFAKAAPGSEVEMAWAETMDRVTAAADSAAHLAEVLAEMPKAPWRNNDDRQTYTPYPGERKAYGEALDDWARRLREFATPAAAPTTETEQ